MQKTIQELHELFYAQTDFEITSKFKAWQKYAEWLESLHVQELNNDLIKEIKFLRLKVQDALCILEEGLVTPPEKFFK